MDAGQVRTSLTAVSERLAALGVRSLSLFGSVARGQGNAHSDLDFLVEFDGPATFDRYMGLKELLETEFGRQVDLVTLRALKPALRDQVLTEAVRVA